MAVLISNGATTLNTTDGFYNVESHNLACLSATALSLATTRNIDVTFANAGNCQGVVLFFLTVLMTDRRVIVRLQENTGSWVTRAETTLTTEDIAGTRTSGIYQYRGQYITPVVFGTPYAVDTTAAKWRFQIAHGTGTGTWQLKTSNGTDPFYATWCDNAATFADGDVLICKDKVTIDKTATTGAVLGTGDTTGGVGVVLCTNHTDPTPENVAMLEWVNPAPAPYTFNARGQIICGSYSGIRIGTAAARIPLSSRATFEFGTPAVGTLAPRIITPSGVAASTFGGLGSFFAYGEIPTYQKTFLTADALIGQNKLLVEDEVDWVAGDQVVVGKQNIQGQGVVTIHTIASVSGNEITLTTNLATNDRLSGGSVIRLGGHGVLITSAAAQIPNHIVWDSPNFVLSGVDLFNQRFSLSGGTTYYYFLASIPASLRSQHLVEDVAVWTTSNSCSHLLTTLAPPEGFLMQRAYCHRQNFSTSGLYYTQALSGFKSGRTVIKDSIMQCQYGGTISVSGNIRLTIENCRFENGRASVYFCSWTGMEGIFKNNYFFGNATTEAGAGAVRIGQCINPTEISGNVYENNVCALGFASLPSVKCVEKEATFVGNTADIGFLVEAFPDYTFDSPNGLNTILYENALEMVVGGSVRLINVDEEFDDRVIYTFGRTRRCKAGLSDETVRTEGGSSLRFNPISSVDLFEFSFDVPTGNIQGKTMTVAIWNKIGNAGYWAGTHTMPTLKVVYDSETVISKSATQITDWQQLAVTFTPLTTSGKVTVTLSGVTDASETDGYFYWDDISVLYPAGYKLDLGGLDIWDAGLPVLPPISTVMSASDVWAVDKSTLTGSGSIGEHLAKKVLSVSKFLGLK